MGTGPANNNNAGVVRDLRFQSIFLSFDIENDNVCGDKTRGCVCGLDFLRDTPLRRLCVGNPGRDPRARIGVSFDESLKLFTADYYHARASASS